MKSKKGFKTITALLLSFIMLFGTLPVQVFAATETGKNAALAVVDGCITDMNSKKGGNVSNDVIDSIVGGLENAKTGINFSAKFFTTSDKALMTAANSAVAVANTAYEVAVELANAKPASDEEKAALAALVEKAKKNSDMIQTVIDFLQKLPTDGEIGKLLSDAQSAFEVVNKLILSEIDYDNLTKAQFGYYVIQFNTVILASELFLSSQIIVDILEIIAVFGEVTKAVESLKTDGSVENVIVQINKIFAEIETVEDNKTLEVLFNFAVGFVTDELSNLVDAEVTKLKAEALAKYPNVPKSITDQIDGWATEIKAEIANLKKADIATAFEIIKKLEVCFDKAVKIFNAINTELDGRTPEEYLCDVLDTMLDCLEAEARAISLEFYETEIKPELEDIRACIKEAIAKGEVALDKGKAAYECAKAFEARIEKLINKIGDNMDNGTYYKLVRKAWFKFEAYAKKELKDFEKEVKVKFVKTDNIKKFVHVTNVGAGSTFELLVDSVNLDGYISAATIWLNDELGVKASPHFEYNLWSADPAEFVLKNTTVTANPAAGHQVVKAYYNFPLDVAGKVACKNFSVETPYFINLATKYIDVYTFDQVKATDGTANWIAGNTINVAAGTLNLAFSNVFSTDVFDSGFEWVLNTAPDADTAYNTGGFAQNLLAGSSQKLYVRPYVNHDSEKLFGAIAEYTINVAAEGITIPYGITPASVTFTVGNGAYTGTFRSTDDFEDLTKVFINGSEVGFIYNKVNGTVTIVSSALNALAVGNYTATFAFGDQTASFSVAITVTSVGRSDDNDRDRDNDNDNDVDFRDPTTVAGAGTVTIEPEQNAQGSVVVPGSTGSVVVPGIEVIAEITKEENALEPQIVVADGIKEGTTPLGGVKVNPRTIGNFDIAPFVISLVSLAGLAFVLLVTRKKFAK